MLDALRTEMEASERFIRARLERGPLPEPARVAFIGLVDGKREAWRLAGGDEADFPLTALDGDLDPKEPLARPRKKGR